MDTNRPHGYSRPHVVRDVEDWERRMFPSDQADQRRPIIMGLTPEEAALIRECRALWVTWVRRRSREAKP